jgi:hypothetical protein
MSTQTLKICDIDRCSLVAFKTVEKFIYTRWLDNGTELVFQENVDLCTRHHYAYVTAVPVVHINGDNAHRRQQEDIR